MKINKELFGSRLKALMKDYNENTYTLSKVLNLSPPTISRYSRGEMIPKMTTIEILAKYFNVNPKYLTGESNSIFENEILNNDVSVTSLPVFETIKYNRPIFSNKKLNEELSLPIDLLSKWGAVIAVKAPDDSMKPFIEKDDKLVIKLGDAELSSPLIALHINKNDMIIRKVVSNGKQFILQPANFDYNPEVINVNKDDIQVIGKVVFARSEKDTLFEE